MVLAFRLFFRVLFQQELAEQVRPLLEAPTEVPAAEAARPAEPTPAALRQLAPSRRSDALTLLAALQREARFIDFIQEPIHAYSDAQVGAAVREVHRACGQVVERMFGLRAVITQDEGSEIEIPVDFDAERFRLTGRVSDNGPQRGRLVHHGWEATRCELPSWTGRQSSMHLVAPAEVEVS
jgi:hypothetical protein